MTVFLSRKTILAVHEEQLAEHGGAMGLRDEGLLDRALARPSNRAVYGDPDIAKLAAVHAPGIARDHPFVDGNKRTAYVAMEAFPVLNGCRFVADDAEAAAMVLAMAAGECDDEDFVAWVRRNTAPS